IDKPGTVELGSDIPDATPGMSGPEHEQTEHAVAFVEKWTEWASSELGSLYDEARKAIKAGEWKNSWYEYVMSLVAPRFGLTSPPKVPTRQDTVAVAAIRDRYETMTTALGERLSITKGAADAWDPGPGTGVTVTDAFFALSPAAQVDRLFTLLLEAMGGITAALAPTYIEFADLNHQHMGGPDP